MFRLSSLIRRVAIAALLCLIGLPLLPGAYASADEERPGTGRIVARDVRRAVPPTGGAALGLAEATSGGASEVFDAGIRFGHLGVHWQLAAGAGEDDARIEFRTSLDGTGWGPWREAVEQHDLADDLARERYANPQHVGVARYAQYRLMGAAGAV
ncbi:MAG: hypothetical protein M3Q61_00640, partial [Chloroflexota bacterium]|nr:hypothetical protein [Chloroflexota bacterium]